MRQCRYFRPDIGQPDIGCGCKKAALPFAKALLPDLTKSVLLLPFSRNRLMFFVSFRLVSLPFAASYPIPAASPGDPCGIIFYCEGILAGCSGNLASRILLGFLWHS